MGVAAYFHTLGALTKLFAGLSVLNMFAVYACISAASDTNILLQSTKGHKMTTFLTIILHDEYKVTIQPISKNKRKNYGKPLIFF